MKHVPFLLRLIFCVVPLAGCVSTLDRRESHFRRVELTEEDMRFDELLFWNTYPLTQNEMLGFNVNKMSEDPNKAGYVMHLLDKHKKQIVFSSEPFDWPEDYWLNVYKTRHYMLVLWEIEMEYTTALLLYVFEPNSKQFSFAGEFDVTVFHPTAEYNPFDVDQIGIATSDSLVTFKFSKKLWFGTTESESRLADSIAYELDLRDKKLRLTKIWNEQEYDSPNE